MKTLTIKAQKIIAGHGPLWQLRDQNGNQVADEGCAYDTRSAAVAACHMMYPSNSVWQGKQTAHGWRIVIN